MSDKFEMQHPRATDGGYFAEAIAVLMVAAAELRLEATHRARSHLNQYDAEYDALMRRAHVLDEAIGRIRDQMGPLEA